MTQEFRIFTQRLTDKPNETTRIFNVKAKTIVDRFGNDVVDAKGNKIWFPENFEPAAAIAFGKSLASDPTLKSAVSLYRNVRQGGPWDLQRSYNGQSNGLFASVFTNAASYVYGLIGAAAGFSTTTLMAAAGGYNAVVNPKTAGPNFGNNPNNPPFISKGIRDFFASSYGPPATIPDTSFQGSRTADRFQDGFGRRLEGVSDDVNRLAASAATGKITPSAGFADPTNANRYAGSFPQPLDSVTSFGRDGWLSSMHRNSEVERIMRDRAVAPPPVSGLPDDSGAFGDRFGRWGFSPAGIEAPPISDGPASFNHRFGAWSTVPAGGLGDSRSPVLRELEKYRRSLAPDEPVPSSVQGELTPAFQLDAMYPPTGDFFGNFPRGSDDAETPLPTAFKTSGPAVGDQSIDNFGAVGDRSMGVLDGFMGNSSMDPAAQMRGLGAADFSSEGTDHIDPSENAPGGRRPARYQLRRVSSAFPNVTPRDPGQPVTPSQFGPLLGIFSREPILPLPHAVWGLPDRSSTSPRDALSGILAGLSRRDPAELPPDDDLRGFHRDERGRPRFLQSQR
ncbi:MAG: polymorphic toxin type 44 domain-containing protein [Pseudomonadota bacterium]